MLEQSIQMFSVQRRGDCPADLETLDQATEHDIQETDPWGTRYRFDCTGATDVVVWSAGPDQRFGNDDDIDNLYEG